MFFSLKQIENSLEKLESVHPFFGITFLVCKENRLPIGRVVEFPINALERNFLDRYYKPAPSSDYYYRVFRPSDQGKKWVASRYPSSTLQSVRTRGDFQPAFIHDKATALWGWHRNYVTTLKRQLQVSHGELVPAFHLAVWLYRSESWPSDILTTEIIQRFLQDFNITQNESKLFDTTEPTMLDRNQVFQDAPVGWEELRKITGTPPDAPQEEGGTLGYLEIRGTGPVKRLVLEPADRLNLITGDNGLGKTFLLECSWWALTGQWSGLQAYPRDDARANEPRITFQLLGESSRAEKITVAYNWETQTWLSPRERPTIPGLTVYARVDGSFAVWDPAKSLLLSNRRSNNLDALRPMLFSSEEVWNGTGLEQNATGRIGARINGLIRDWTTWQSQPAKYPFETFKDVLRRLSPPSESDLGELEPGEPVRLPYDAREFPTLKHPYGTVPIIYASAGVRRIVTLAYLIVWAWEEHKLASEFMRREAQRRMVILIDEMEAHLHPQWQRVILPALLKVHNTLKDDLQVQLLVSTHSPLVMASVETHFEKSSDKLFHLNLVKQDLFGSEVRLEQHEFIRYGAVDSWLISDIFELGQPRSIEAEEAIEEAKALQLRESAETEEIQRVSDRLSKTLSIDDEFWPRWTYFAEQHGVKM